LPDASHLSQRETTFVGLKPELLPAGVKIP
jgi:hypothetical protein